MTNQELREQLKAKFTDELAIGFNINSQEERIKAWHVIFKTNSRETDLGKCVNVFENSLDSFINEIMSEGLIYLKIDPPLLSVYPFEEESK